jgi:dsDNA-binding SOS-regulon protein
MHTSKTDADKHDLMLEIGERITDAVMAAAPNITKTDAEAVGLFLSRQRDLLVKVCKGATDSLDGAIAELSQGTVVPLRNTN